MGFFENYYVNKKFDEFESHIENLMVLIENEEVEIEDISELEDWWTEAAGKLHIFTPHTVIKDIEFWLAEAKSFIKTRNFDLALAKMEIIKSAAKSIPDCYGVDFGNIF